MPISLYMDEHVPRAITIGLRLRQIDVLTAQDDGKAGASDCNLLDRAAELQRVLFSHDDDLLKEAVRRQKDNTPFQGVIYAHPLRVSIGGCINNLEMIARVVEPEDLMNRVEFLPL